MIKTIQYMVMAGAMALISLTSCLDVEPESAIPTDQAMATFDDAEQTVTGIYALLKSSALYSGYLTLLPDVQSDLVYAIDGYSNTFGNFWQWQIRPTASEIEAVYAALYQVISNCNFYLENIDEVMEKQVVEEKILTLDQYTGEVYTIRALAYSELLKCFCKAYDPATAEQELGVVLRKGYALPERSVRASLKESYEFVLSDLQMAEELLDPDNDQISAAFMTQAVAYALHARVALYMQNWEDAVKYSSLVIDHPRKVYSLSPANSLYTSDMTYFDYMWNYDVGTEIIWRVGFTATSYGGALGSVFLHFTNDYTYYYPDYVPAQWVLDLYDSGDMRYSSYFYELQTGHDHQLTWPLLVKYYGNQDLISGSLVYHVNMPKPFRLAEQYLIRAEALCRQEKPDFAGASRDMNTLRSNRYVSGGAISLTEKDYLEKIAEERVRELYMEGFRLHDLKRWGSLYNGGGFERTPQQHSLAEGSSLRITADNPLFVWPIPQHEIEAPGSEVVGNESNK
ncbi:MAG: RagB/SusD family nutrient uptake outer membrane protein [Tidjanibacter sp.]|nr:RagB/SusD family nutrient uptake outer membrane protein [Tidjanibacter sp.]